MPAVVMVAVAVVAAAVTAGVALLVQRGRPLPPEEVAERTGLRALVRRRLHPLGVSGLALGVSMVGLVLAVAAFGLMAGVAERSRLWWVDAGAADWGSDHATPVSTTVLSVATWLGDGITITVLAAVVIGVETARGRLRGHVLDAALFAALVLAGQSLLVQALKLLFDRDRPLGFALVGADGAAFPSGHTANATATFALLALLLGRGHSRPVRVALIALAGGVVGAVGATRILLAVHWVSDVIGGLAVGACWFAVCALLFGGRRLQLGAPLGQAEPPGSGDAARRQQPSS